MPADPADGSPTPAVTIVVVPRERFSCSIECLERLYEVTDTPFELVYVDGRSPRRTRRRLAELSERHGFTLLRSERYLSPNAARNLAMSHVSTPYVAFVDNDLLVTPGWLESLLTAAEETGAWAVGPLYFEGDPSSEVIHMAGGSMSFEGAPGHRQVLTDHRYQHRRLSEVPELRRERCDYIEFHCVLLRTDALATVGPLDERYLATREHLDLCLRLAEAGGEVWYEPSSRVTYLSPPPVPLGDVTYFWLRWSDDWSRASLATFCEEYGVDPSYMERQSVMRGRRQAVFAPALQRVRRIAGDGVADSLDKVLRRAEPLGNRLLTRALVVRGVTKADGTP